MNERGHVRDWPTFAFVFVGLAVGHFFSYLIAIPDPARRALVLSRSGHGYLHLASDIAVILGIAAVVTVGLRALHARDGAGRSSDASLILRLGALQAGAFIAMELGERIASSAGTGELFTDHLFGVGIIVQLAIAAIGGLLLRWIARATARIADAFARPARGRAAGVLLVRSTASRKLRPAFAGIVGARAPPLP